MPPIALPDPPLEDGTISLRAFVMSDARAVADAIQDPEIGRWTSLELPYSVEHASGWIAGQEEQRRSGASVDFAITDTTSCAFVGAIGLAGFDEDRRIAQIGYWMAREARNKGFATRAVVLVSAWAFDALHLERLWLTTIVGNTPSEKVAAKADFRQIELIKDEEVGTRTVDVIRWERPAAYP
jgi:RimJ/RimL family protein N-acetyltransferase